MDSSSKKILIIYSIVAWAIIAEQRMAAGICISTTSPNIPEGMAKELAKPGCLEGRRGFGQKKNLQGFFNRLRNRHYHGNSGQGQIRARSCRTKGAVFLDEKWNIESFR